MSRRNPRTRSVARVRRTITATTIAIAAGLVAPGAAGFSFAHSPRPQQVVQAPPRVDPVALGSSGPRVLQVQSVLRRVGYSIAADGVFGPRTQAAVKAFQASRGLRVDGIVGPATSAALGLTSTAPAPTAAPATPATGTPATGRYVHPSPLVDRWHDAAIAAGWPEAEWQQLSCIIFRESGGNPAAKNPSSSASGLMQIMWSVHSRWIGGSVTQLFDGPTNLRLGRQLFERAGSWQPWTARSSC